MSALLRLRALAANVSSVKWSAALHTTLSDGRQQPNGWRMDDRQTKAVIFDMGGVIIPSPLPFLIEFEKRIGLPRGIINKVVSSSGTNAWAQMERGEISIDEFGEKFSEECSAVYGKRVDLSRLMYEMQSHLSVSPYPEMIDALRCLRAEGIKTALLTNNFNLPNGSYIPLDTSPFDIVVESVKVRMRKPEERIYRHTLDLLNVAPQDAVFLDDLGGNVKAARDLGIKTIKVSNSQQAIRELEEVVGFPLRGFVEGTSLVPKKLQISIGNLKAYLDQTLNLSGQDDPVVRCFEHGQSNPTYSVFYAGRTFVLRKKPPGKLLPSAHAVEREYRVMKAVSEHGVPVPQMLCLCEDNSVSLMQSHTLEQWQQSWNLETQNKLQEIEPMENVIKRIGTPFYLMEYVRGRIFKDPTLPGLSKEERRQIYAATIRVLASIHKVNIKAAGLEDYGKSGEYLKRNFARWSKQYEASKTGPIEAMDKLTAWLTEHMPDKEMITLVHGDFRIDNLIFHPEKPEVLAVLDWELSTIGDPITDLSNSGIIYYLPDDIPIIAALTGQDLKTLGIPEVQEYIGDYAREMNIAPLHNWDYYVTYTFFRMAAILQGVYKRFTIGQSTNPMSEAAGLGASKFAEVGWSIASRSSIPVSKQSLGVNTRNYSTDARTSNMPLSIAATSPRVQDLFGKVKKFISNNIIPLESEFYQWSADPSTRWTIHPKMEQLKKQAKAEGLWNLFLPLETDSNAKYGAGLTNVEYAFLAEEMGKSLIASEVFNCSAPDTGNMEVLARYGTEEQKQRWLVPLLEGEIRSCFAMTEPAVASSDATNIQSSIRRDGNEYVINGHKWWTSGAMDPRCKVCIFMGKTDSSGAVHRQQSMIIVPMDAPGIKIVRPLSVFGFEDGPHGHAEVIFEDVRVPVENILLGEGRGFEIAQGRLGPGRIHHCMRTIGSTERALDLMVARVQSRHAFGKPLADQGTIQQDIARSRIDIEQGRLLVLKAAHVMDIAGNKAAAAEIAMIKVAVPSMAGIVIDRAMQAHGGMGLCQDTPLAQFYMWSRVLRLADGPDEVHLRSIAKAEIRRSRPPSKL